MRSSILARRINFLQKSSRNLAELNFSHGLPVITVSLPSRNEPVSFTCRPVTGTIGDLLEQIKEEDRGVDHAAIYAQGEIRLASATTISQLLTMGDFQLRINDIRHQIQLPDDQIARLLLVNEDNEMAAIKQLVHSLHSSLGIAEFQFQHHKKLTAKRDEIMKKLKKCQLVKQKIDEDAIKFSQQMHTGAMIGMSVLWGIMARLTWWEYSWDVIEPVTFFVTYGGAICCYTFYLATKTLPEYEHMTNRWQLLKTHKLSSKRGFSIEDYNLLSHEYALVCEQIDRLEDELQLLLTEEAEYEDDTGADDSFLDF
ncbi:unnamed protein product [Oikopleura dioica]|uniref:Calcium uniporter protein n=1 Tax=Oikopleura dioica TaxID=34765 RepID=E4X901_OIKDI|nr:unnamed protein product [Oikopleura dioica]